MHWKKYKNKDHHGFKLYDNTDNVVLKMELANKKSPFKATLECEKQTYKIKRRGFWKSHILITDNKDKFVAELINEKLHFGMGNINMGKQKYFYVFRNNPLAELCINSNDHNHPLISYKLITKSRIATVTLETSNELNKIKLKHLLVGIGWYLFQPIATENSIIHSQ